MPKVLRAGLSLEYPAYMHSLHFANRVYFVVQNKIRQGNQVHNIVRCIYCILMSSEAKRGQKNSSLQHLAAVCSRPQAVQGLVGERERQAGKPVLVAFSVGAAS